MYWHILNEKKWIIQGKHGTFQNERGCFIYVFPMKTEKYLLCLLPHVRVDRNRQYNFYAVMRILLSSVCVVCPHRFILNLTIC